MNSFLTQLHDDQIVRAIQDAEKLTSAEIRVFINRKKVADPLPAAEKEFLHLNMQNTAQRNGVLIFVAPRSRNFAIVGDTAIHALAGQTFWQQITDEMTPHFRNHSPTEALLLAIQKAAHLLAHHFPRLPNDQNELPNTVARD